MGHDHAHGAGADSKRLVLALALTSTFLVAEVIGAVVFKSLAVVATFAPTGPERCSGLPVARYDAERLATRLGPRLRLIHAETEDHVTPGGVVQAFTWTAFQRAD